MDRKGKKTAVFLCRGCDIGSSFDLAVLQKLASRDRNVGHSEVFDCLCAGPGLARVREAVSSGFSSLVIGACSGRFQTRSFLFEECFTERVNLREMVAWSHEPASEDTQMLAEDVLRMGLARAGKAGPAVRRPESSEQAILVVGGGPAGMAAALAAARAGHFVFLVERDDALGGRLREFGRLFPSESPYPAFAPVDLPVRVREIVQESLVSVHLGTRIERIDGSPGQFHVTLLGPDGPGHVRVGAIVQATGWRPYDATRLGHLGYGHSLDVVTNLELEKLLSKGPLLRPSDGGPARRVAFVQCAGSRDAEHLATCSGVCCRTTLKQALWLRELDPEAEAYVFYKDIRTPGTGEDYYRRAQEDPGIFFAKGEVRGVSASMGQALSLTINDSLLGASVEVEADLVVLATGMVPVAADSEAIRKLCDARAVIAKDEIGLQLDAARQAVVDLSVHEGTEILHLGYRQGPDLPLLEAGYPDAHFICFPYETRRTGVYVAGCARTPADIESSRADGEGAALKAIQCVTLCEKGLAVHPRWEDASVADFSLQRCTQCKRCTEECPFGSLDEDEKGTPRPNPTRCRRCGICLGACPERLVAFNDYSVDLVSSMIKAVEIPDELDEKPRLLALLCENDAYPALDAAGFDRIRHSPYFRVIPVRCLGAVNVVWIADALARGFDGILLVGCKSGNDYQCHFIRGSELMGTRSENIRQKLVQLALEEQRVRVEEVALSDFGRLPAILDDFAAQIAAIGPNPFKGA
jgi:quinone-modifying oxidoreductase, subunit QmoB